MSNKFSFSDFDFCINDRVFKSPKNFHHPYSDGSFIENKILQILKNSKDNSIFSKELSNNIENWPTEYHFSHNRHNLLKHIDLNNKTFLELGAGCGGLTRYIGENAKNVIGVEGSLIRAKCASQRCKDLKNVKIYCANFNDLIPEEKFDYVSLIGVLEYASLYSKSKSPFIDYIKVASKFLKQDGKLIIAIENKLGLKYFSGLSEDHTSTAYFGLYDLYKEKTVRTFGKFELVELLINCGFKYNNFFYPFPDYKIPIIMLTEKALIEKINISDILFRIIPRDYSKHNNRNFYDNLVWETIEKNKLIDQFSNSFLIISSKKKIIIENDLVYHYTTDRRNRYNVNTTFKKVSNEIVVSKSHTIKNVIKTNENIISHKIVSDKYVYGTLLEKKITKEIVAGRIDGLIENLNMWLKFLFANAIQEIDENIYLSKIKKEYFDCIPKNLILHNENVFYFDREWDINNNMNLYFLILKYFLFWDNQKIYHIDKFFANNKSYLVNIFMLLKIPIIKSEFRKFEIFISDLRSEILGNKYKYKFNYCLLKKKKFFIIKKIIKKILIIIQLILSKIIGKL